MQEIATLITWCDLFSVLGSSTRTPDPVVKSEDTVVMSVVISPNPDPVVQLVNTVVISVVNPVVRL